MFSSHPQLVPAGCIQVNVITYTIAAGDGKTHYIKTKLALLDEYVVISVNEAFTPSKAISKLQKLSFDTQKSGIFFNFTMLPPGVSW